jgi:hypothetical protein
MVSWDERHLLRGEHECTFVHSPWYNSVCGTNPCAESYRHPIYQLNVFAAMFKMKMKGSHTAALAPATRISLARSSKKRLRGFAVELEWSSLDNGMVEASHCSGRHFPGCRRVAGGAVAVRWQRPVDPWRVQNGREVEQGIDSIREDGAVDGPPVLIG